MLGATERYRPILEYVRKLENQVRELRGRERRWNSLIFLAGFAAGTGAGWIAWHLLR
jgi:hypothetical protein